MLNSAPQKLYQNLQKRQKMISKQFSQYSSASTKTSEAEIKGLSLSSAFPSITLRQKQGSFSSSLYYTTDFQRL